MDQQDEVVGATPRERNRVRQRRKKIRSARELIVALSGHLSDALCSEGVTVNDALRVVPLCDVFLKALKAQREEESIIKPSNVRFDEQLEWSPAEIERIRAHASQVLAERRPSRA